MSMKNEFKIILYKIIPNNVQDLRSSILFKKKASLSQG